MKMEDDCTDAITCHWLSPKKSVQVEVDAWIPATLKRL